MLADRQSTLWWTCLRPSCTRPASILQTICNVKDGCGNTVIVMGCKVATFNAQPIAGAALMLTFNMQQRRTFSDRTDIV